jgi:hypothetical protein
MSFTGTLKKYGRTGIAVYLGLTTMSYASIYFLLKTGVDFKPMLERLNIKSDNAGSASHLIAAYAINKVLSPLKLLLTASITPRIHRYFSTRFTTGMKL